MKKLSWRWCGTGLDVVWRSQVKRVSSTIELVQNRLNAMVAGSRTTMKAVRVQWVAMECVETENDLRSIVWQCAQLQRRSSVWVMRLEKLSECMERHGVCAVLCCLSEKSRNAVDILKMILMFNWFYDRVEFCLDQQMLCVVDHKWLKRLIHRNW